MSPSDSKHLQQFAYTFDLINLGHDTNAGLNALASMACTLANVARPGSGIVTPKGNRMHIGSSLLVNGALSSSIVNDNVVTELRLCQNNLTAHLRKLHNTQQQSIEEGTKLHADPKANHSEDALLSLQNLDPELAPAPIETNWAHVLSASPTPRIRDLATQPKIVVTASRPQDLTKQLIGSHQGHPLVLLGLNPAYRSKHSNTILTAVVDGRLPNGQGGEALQGNLLVTDTDNALFEIAKSANGNDTWLGRTLWLVDGNAGPEIPDPAAKLSGGQFGNVSSKFNDALKLAFGKRLNQHEPEPVLLPIDLGDAQSRWVDFLKGMEPDLPGITGTARKLLATLAFGIHELTHIPGTKAFNVPVLFIEILARHLVQRMANARTSMLFSSEMARKKHLQQSILEKLADGFLTPRNLVRRFDRLKTPECLTLLQGLEAEGKVICKGKTYGLSDSMIAATSPLTLTA